MKMPSILLAAIAGLMLLPEPAIAGFNRLTSEVQRSGHKRTYIPFLGLARTFVRIANPHGVHDFRLAVFEGRRSGERLSHESFEKIVNRSIQRGWQPLVRVTSRRSDERTIILARPEGNRIRLLICTVEPKEAVVVELAIHPDRFVRFIEESQTGQVSFLGRR